MSFALTAPLPFKVLCADVMLSRRPTLEIERRVFTTEHHHHMFRDWGHFCHQDFGAPYRSKANRALSTSSS